MLVENVLFKDKSNHKLQNWYLEMIGMLRNVRIYIGDLYNKDRKSSLKQVVILNYRSINRIQVSEYYSNF